MAYLSDTEVRFASGRVISVTVFIVTIAGEPDIDPFTRVRRRTAVDIPPRGQTPANNVRAAINGNFMAARNSARLRVTASENSAVRVRPGGGSASRDRDRGARAGRAERTEAADIDTAR